MNDDLNQNAHGEIIDNLKEKYPGKYCYDVDGRGMHFACEIDPGIQHPDYDKVVEMIILSRAHKYDNVSQTYKVVSGTLDLHVGDDVFTLYEGNQYEIEKGLIRWGESTDNCLVEITSKPARAIADRIIIE